MSSIIRTMRYVDVSDLPKEAKDAYSDFIIECGVNNGEHWSFEVGESGDDSIMCSYIGQEKTDLISQALMDAGLEKGELISLVHNW